MQPAHKQRMGYAGLIAMLALLASIGPICADLYMPALPDLVVYFKTSESALSFTITGFFFSMGFGMLIGGTVSDQFGRKLTLLVAAVLFTAAAFLCALTPSVELLIALRMIEGFCGGGLAAMSTAIVKDCISFDRQGQVLGIVQVLHVIAPMVAPVIGSSLMLVFDWRVTFYAQVVVGLAVIILVCFFEESLPKEQRTADGLLSMFNAWKELVLNKRFVSLMLLIALIQAPLMTYIVNSSFIYMVQFGLSKMEYSLFFGVNSAFMGVGALLVIIVRGRLNISTVMTISLLSALICGSAILIVGGHSAVAFFLSLFMHGLICNFMRPYATTVLIQSIDRNAGAASSLINFVCSMLGCFAMVIADFPWPSYSASVGGSAVFFGLVSLVLWLVARRWYSNR